MKGNFSQYGRQQKEIRENASRFLRVSSCQPPLCVVMGRTSKKGVDPQPPRVSLDVIVSVGLAFFGPFAGNEPSAAVRRSATFVVVLLPSAATPSIMDGGGGQLKVPAFASNSTLLRGCALRRLDRLLIIAAAAPPAASAVIALTINYSGSPEI